MITKRSLAIEWTDWWKCRYFIWGSYSARKCHCPSLFAAWTSITKWPLRRRLRQKSRHRLRWRPRRRHRRRRQQQLLLRAPHRKAQRRTTSVAAPRRDLLDESQDFVFHFNLELCPSNLNGNANVPCTNFGRNCYCFVKVIGNWDGTGCRSRFTCSYRFRRYPWYGRSVSRSAPPSGCPWYGSRVRTSRAWSKTTSSDPVKSSVAWPKLVQKMFAFRRKPRRLAKPVATQATFQSTVN